MIWNTRNLLLVLSIMSLAVSPVSVSAKKDEAGVIKGQVNYCSQGGYIGMQVFIPGRQFMAFLGEDGSFTFDNVPEGTFNINYVINGKLVFESNNIIVRAGETNDIGLIGFCDKSKDKSSEAQEPVAAVKIRCNETPDLAECKDVDKDGVIAAKDCDDNNANIHPGAVELCDNIDNNCNGKIDEVLNVEIPNGIGLCNQGGVVTLKSCNDGFGDCDGDQSNGCETDIYNNNKNCGSCGNECSDLEVCKLGIC
ncbi:MAG: MopE-related protein [Gammaproteobacteria bacterium]|jgi:hypothetical protein